MLFLALQHLIARRKQTAFTLLGIVLGATAFVVISGFFSGFQGFIIDQLINNDAHIRISAREDFLYEHTLDEEFFGKLGHVFWISPPSGRKDSAKVEDPEGWYRRLTHDPRVIAYSPQLTAQVILSRGQTTLPVRVIGSIPQFQEKVTNVAQYMIQGKFSDISVGGNRLIVGNELLDRIGARVSDTLLVSTGKAAPVPFKIVGAFKIGIKALDEGTAFGELSDVQRINLTPSQVNEIAIRVQNVDDAHAIADGWAAFSPDKVRSWDVVNANFLSVVNIQNATKSLMIATILIVAGFGIYNILNMVVTQKKKDIAILRSMGFESKDVLFLFLSQGMILGILGGILGTCLGYLVCQYMTTIPFGGGPIGSGTGYLTISFNPKIYIQALFLSTLSASIASLLPARAAGRMTPIDIIRAGTE